MIIPGWIKSSAREKKHEKRRSDSIMKLVASAGSVKRNDAIPENHGCEEGKSDGPPVSISWRTDVRNKLVGQWPNLQPGNNPPIINVPANVFNLLDI